MQVDAEACLARFSLSPDTAALIEKWGCTLLKRARCYKIKARGWYRVVLLFRNADRLCSLKVFVTAARSELKFLPTVRRKRS